ncbi:MAG: hypothetical protein J7575_09815 [Chloroflexi bacterium]|nr:hypothetical protein [Chloroflexota bacterium]
MDRKHPSFKAAWRQPLLSLVVFLTITAMLFPNGMFPPSLTARPMQEVSPLEQPPSDLLSPLFQSPLPLPEVPEKGVEAPPPSLPLPPEEKVGVRSGQAISLAQGRLTLGMPPDAPVRAVSLRVTRWRPLAPREAGVAFAFDLTAADGQGKPLTRFSTPLTITLQLGDLVNWSSRPDWLRPWVGYWDEKRQGWQTITPTRVDEQAGVVTFTTDHLSIFGAGSQGVTVSGWLLNFNDTRTDRFSGALVWEYPFDLPPGPGGIRPDVRLSYNSRRVDGVLTWAQSDGVGWGWSIDTAEIMWRNVRRCDSGHSFCWDSVPLFVLNGEALKLVPETSLPGNIQYLGPITTTYRFRTEDERFLRVEWKPGNENGWWEVTLRDGTRYLFGTTADSRQVLRGNIVWTGSGWLTRQATVRWRLKQIIYPTGVTVTYTYTEQTYQDQCNIWYNEGLLPRDNPYYRCPTGDDASSERASYLSQIEYPGTRVRLVWGRRWNGNGPNDGIGAEAYRWDFADAGMLVIFWQTDALQKVVLERRKSDGSWTAVREWRFTYGTFVPQENKVLRILTGLQEWAPQGGGWVSLPAITFGYQGYWNKGWCGDCPSEWDRSVFVYPRLVRIDNGYGGVITAGYETPDGGYWQGWNYRVAWRQVTDGLGGGWREAYSYSGDSRGRCYLHNEDQAACKWPIVGHFPDGGGGVPVTGGLFLGYREVTVTFQDLNGNPQRVEWTRFALPEGPTNDPWPVRGRPREHQVRNPNGQVLQTVASTYGISPTLGGAHFVFLQRQDTTTDGRTARTEWRYDAYGNVSALFEHGFLDVSGDERATHRGYALHKCRFFRR